MTSGIQNRIEDIARMSDGKEIIEHFILAKGIEKLSEQDIQELKKLTMGREHFIRLEMMEILKENNHAIPTEIYGVKNRFVKVNHTIYRLIQDSSSPDGWYALPEKFFREE